MHPLRMYCVFKKCFTPHSFWREFHIKKTARSEKQSAPKPKQPMKTITPIPFLKLVALIATGLASLTG